MQTAFAPGGLLIAVEGIDGAGKTTQVGLLASAFRALGHVVVTSKEPTSGRWGNELRQTAFGVRRSRREEHDLLLRDREEHVKNLVAPALARAEVVILDRYYFSSIAYQSDSDLSPAEILQDNARIAPEPDVLLILDCDPSVGISRIVARGDKPNSFESHETLARCRAEFRAMTAIAPAILIDASAPISDVTTRCFVSALQMGAKKCLVAETVLGQREALSQFLGLMNSCTTSRLA